MKAKNPRPGLPETTHVGRERKARWSIPKTNKQKKNPVNIAKGDTWNQNLYLYLLKYIALGYF